MTERLPLGRDEFAFLFETTAGVDADALATFLKRAAAVARRGGGELHVVGLREGSLVVVLKAIRKGVIQEFVDKPVDTTIKTSAFVGGIVAAIVHFMSPQLSGNTPLARAGADLVKKRQVTRIDIVTNGDSTVVMDQTISEEVRRVGKRRDLPVEIEKGQRISAPVASMLRDARGGVLSGKTAFVNGELHFRPHGHRYWVPIHEDPGSGHRLLKPDAAYRVSGHIVLSHGQPDRIVIHSAMLISD